KPVYSRFPLAGFGDSHGPQAQRFTPAVDEYVGMSLYSQTRRRKNALPAQRVGSLYRIAPSLSRRPENVAERVERVGICRRQRPAQRLRLYARRLPRIESFAHGLDAARRVNVVPVAGVGRDG